MQEPNQANFVSDADNDEISLLDLLLTVAENIRLLVLGPLAAGLIALGVGSFLPKTYESVAIIDPVQKPDLVVSLASSVLVLDPVIEKLGLSSADGGDAAREELSRRIKASAGKKDGLVTIKTSGPSPETARDLGAMILSQLFQAVSPRGDDLIALQRSLELSRALAVKNQAVIDRAARTTGGTRDTSGGEGGSALQGFAELLALQGSLETKIASDERAIRGLSQSDIVQTPTTPTRHVAPKRSLIAVLVALATGFLLLLFVFVRKALTTGVVGDEAAKVDRIKALLADACQMRRSDRSA